MNYKNKSVQSLTIRLNSIDRRKISRHLILIQQPKLPKLMRNLPHHKTEVLQKAIYILLSALDGRTSAYCKSDIKSTELKSETKNQITLQTSSCAHSPVVCTSLGRQVKPHKSLVPHENHELCEMVRHVTH